MPTIQPPPDLRRPRPEWDYTEHAEAYLSRPDYPQPLVDAIAAHAGLQRGAARIVEIGAGTGAMTRRLCLWSGSLTAVEPNAEMRRRGEHRTDGLAVRWIEGTGERTTLPDACADWVMMAQCFDTMDQPAAVREAHRILRPGGHLTVLWNHRDWDKEPIEAEIESLIRTELGQYARGTRRVDQAAVLTAGGLFGGVKYLEQPHETVMEAERYVQVWRSVRTLRVQTGAERFEPILAKIAGLLRARGVRELTVRYTTRSWTVRKQTRG